VVTLWALLLALCFAMPIAGALAAAKSAKVGFGGYALAITVGVALGAFCAWTMHTVGAVVHAHTQGESVPLKERYARALYFAAMLWIILALFIGEWVSLVLLRRVF
jgi:hypothetical protein